MRCITMANSEVLEDKRAVYRHSHMLRNKFAKCLATVREGDAFSHYYSVFEKVFLSKIVLRFELVIDRRLLE